MRILFNGTLEDKEYLGPFQRMLKDQQHTCAASLKAWKYADLQKAARDASCKAILLANPDTLKEHLGVDATLDSYRGSRLNYDIPIIVVNPLAHLHTVDYGQWLLERDMEKLSLVDKPACLLDFQLCDTPQAMELAYETLAAAEFITFDIETNPAAKIITCISFSALGKDGRISNWLLPLFDFLECHYTSDALHMQALQFMKASLALPVRKGAHNGVYDAAWCAYYNMPPIQYCIDTMMLHWSRFSELPKTLDFCSSLYLYDHMQWKHEAEAASDAKDIKGYWTYCAKDSFATMRIALQQLGQTDESSYWVYNYQRTFRQTFVAIYCGFEGCLIDQAKRTELAMKAESTYAENLKTLQIMTATPDFNPGSPKQVATLLYDIIGARQSERGGRSTNEKVLNSIAIQHPLIARFVHLILECRGAAKLLSTYYYFQLDHRGRATWALNPTGAETGRMASSKSCYNEGLQIQNIPQENVKECFIPDEGYVLVEIDKNKSEARCVAYLGQVVRMIEALEDKTRDYYIVLSSEFFGIPYEAVTKYMRNKITKRIIHGSNYMMQEDTFIEAVTPKELYNAMGQLGITNMSLKNFAKYLLSLYHKPFPELKRDWYPAILRMLRTTRMSTSPLGWTRRFFGDVSGYKMNRMLRKAVAHAPQNLSVDLLNEDLWQDYKLCLASNGDLRLKAQIHDSRFMQIRADKLDHYLQLLAQRDKDAAPIIIHGRPMKIPSDIKIGHKNWQHMEEWHGK